MFMLQFANVKQDVNISFIRNNLYKICVHLDMAHFTLLLELIILVSEPSKRHPILFCKKKL